MKHLGDITKISGYNIDPVDCITFGSPCQDLSQAGKRAGLDGERSGLFIHAVRIIKEMRENTNGRYPTFAIWENVPGAFSSNRGEDFRTVLEQLARIKEADAPIPRPEKNKWAKAGIVCGDGYSIAWRTFDAQYWGVPQRRRRIAVVVDFAGHRAGEILFESKGVSGYTEPRIQTWKEAAGNIGNGIAKHDCEAVTYDGYRIFGFSGGNSATAGSIGHAENIAPTPRASANLAGIPSTVYESHSQDARYTQQGNTSPSCTAQWETDGNNMPIVVSPIAIDHAISTGGNSSAQGPCIYTNGISPTLKSAGVHSVCCQNKSKLYVTEKAHALRAKGNCSFREDSETFIVEKMFRWIVRRLTPTECERLQGFPDGWTDIGEWIDSKGKRHKSADSPRYKALGNSIALPQWWWITCKMANYLPKSATLGSLFDGIGGFPLVWETRHGKGTAIWASEIEEFPIAVTKKWFY